MSFRDVFKSSFLENVSAITVLDMGLALLLAFGLGLFIFFVWRQLIPFPFIVVGFNHG